MAAAPTNAPAAASRRSRPWWSRLAEDETPVGILGFSSSGKTTYLAVLYYLTTQAMGAGRKLQDWQFDWDDDETNAYLRAASDRLRGVSSTGFVLRHEQGGVRREFPAGTVKQRPIRFSLTRPAPSFGQHRLSITTVDIAGEVLVRGLDDASKLSGEQVERWREIEGIMRDSRAVLLFVNALQLDEINYSSLFAQLATKLRRSPRRPKVLVLVVTGTDRYETEAALGDLRHDLEERYGGFRRQLEGAGIALEISLVSSLGPGYVTKQPMEVLERNPERFGPQCTRFGHLCPLCQTLSDDEQLDLRPVNTLAPWDAIYKRLFERELAVDFGLQLLALVHRQRWLFLVVALVMLSLPVAGLAWLWSEARAQSERLDTLLAGEITPGNWPTVNEAAQAVRGNPLAGLVPPSAEALARREQFEELQFFRNLAADTELSPGRRLQEAERFLARPTTPAGWAELFPLTELRTQAALERLGQPSAPIWQRLGLGLQALQDPQLPSEARGPVATAVADLLPTAETAAATLQAQLQTEARSPDAPLSRSPIAATEARQLADRLRTFRAASPAASAPQEKSLLSIIGQLGALSETLTAREAFQAIGAQPEATPAERQAKLEAWRTYQNDWANRQVLLAERAGLMQVELSRAVAADTAAALLAALQQQAQQATTVQTVADVARGLRQLAERYPGTPAAATAATTRAALPTVAARAVEAMRLQYSANLRQLQGATTLPPTTATEWTAANTATSRDRTGLRLLAAEFPDLAGLSDTLTTAAQWATLASQGARVATAVAEANRTAEGLDRLADLAAGGGLAPLWQQLATNAVTDVSGRLLFQAATTDLSKLPTFRPEVAELSPSQYDNLIRVYRDYITKWANEGTWRQSTAPYRRLTREAFVRWLAVNEQRDPVAVAELALQQLNSLRSQRSGGLGR